MLYRQPINGNIPKALALFSSSARRLVVRIGQVRLRGRRSKIYAVIVAALLMAGYGVLSTSATTAVLVPDGDVTNTWGGVGGVNDGSCAGGTRCDFVDDGTTDNSNDYITTAGSTAGGETEEYSLSSVTGVSSASQVVVRIYAQDTAVGGGTTDTLSINLRVGGTLQTASTCTLQTYGAACTATFTGSWTQANVDSMQVNIVRNRLGSGSPSSQADTINLYNVYATLTYTPTLTQTQSAYRWFDNQDAASQTTFANAWGGSDAEAGVSVAQTPDGGYVAASSQMSFTSLDSFGGALTGAALVRYDNQGNRSWSTTWGGLDNVHSDIPHSAIPTSDGGYAMTGESASYTGASDMFLAKYSSNGSISWFKTWGSSTGGAIDSGAALVQTSDGGFAVTGYTQSFGAGSDDMFLAKYDSSGNLSWSKTWGGASSDRGNSLVQTSDGGYAVTGYTASYGAGGDDMFLAKYDSSGNLSWSKTWGGTGVDRGSSLIQTSDDGYAVAGSTASYGTATDMFLAKYDSSGNINGCSSTLCQSVTATASSPVAATSSPAVGVASPAATANTYTVTTSSSPGTSTVIVALNAPTIATSTPRAATNTAMTAPDEGTIFRLRLDIHVAGSTVNANAESFKLQYAPKGAAASCSAVATGNFLDVTSTSTIGYANNPVAASGLGLATGANDPAHGTDTNIAQAYYENKTTTITNPATIASGQDGMWDFALRTNQTLQNTSYCLRIVNTGGSLLDTYSVYPELTTPASRFTEAGHRWYNTNPSGGSATFIKAYGSTNGEMGNIVAQTSDGGYVVTGQTYSYGDNVNGDMFISKYDQSGNLSWSRVWGGTGVDYGNSVIQTSDGGYMVVGDTNSFGSGGYDAFLAKYDSSGALSWNKTWGGTATEQGNCIVQTSDGGYIMTGNTSGYGTGGGQDVFLAKLDSSGTPTWTQTWGGAGNDVGYTVIQTSDGGYAVTGKQRSYADTTNGDMFLAKYTSTGTLSWSRTWGGPYADDGYIIVQTSDGGYAVTGNANTMVAGNGNDMYLAKFDSTGALSWNKIWGTSFDEYSTGLTKTSDGGYAITGYGQIEIGGNVQDSILVKFDSSGALSWDRTLGGAGTDRTISVFQTSDGGYVTVGDTNSSGFTSGSTDILMAKYDASGNIAGCSSTTCRDPSITLSSPSATTSSPTPTTNSATATTTTPTATVSSPTMTTTIIVASSVDIGSPLAAQEKPLDLASLTPLALRVALRVDGSGIDTNAQSFKLQYAVRSNEASCQAVSTGLYADVTTATPIAYYDDSRYANGQQLQTNVNDPSDGSRNIRAQSYQEANNFANGMSAIYANEDGVWQFSLNINNTTLKGKNFCLRVATSGGTVLTATSVPDVAYAPLMEELMHGGNWFSRSTETKQNLIL